MILRQGALVVFGALQKGVPSIFPGRVVVLGVSISVQKVVIIGLSLFIMLALYVFLIKTRLGKAIRAVIADEEVASVQGIDVNRIYLITVIIASALAGLAGAMMAPVYAVFPDMGIAMIFIILLVMMVGGLESLAGAALAGLALGLLLSFGYQLIGVYNEVVIFLIVAIFLLLRPQGLFG